MQIMRWIMMMYILLIGLSLRMCKVWHPTEVYEVL